MKAYRIDMCRTLNGVFTITEHASIREAKAQAEKEAGRKIPWRNRGAYLPDSLGVVQISCWG